jgi:hypothetical protein
MRLSFLRPYCSGTLPVAIAFSVTHDSKVAIVPQVFAAGLAWLAFCLTAVDTLRRYREHRGGK